MSKEYGTALFELALETGQTGEFASALDTVEAVFRETPEYLDFLASPNIPVKERLAALEESFSDSVPEYILSFLQLLCESGNSSQLTGSIAEYRLLYDQSRRVAAAKVTSALELTESEKSRLKEKLEKITGNTVNLECAIDASLLGGLLVEVDGRVMDGSLRHRLRDMKDVMST